jgi:microcystin-dependent protein
MATSPTRISELTEVTPDGDDQLVIARGFGPTAKTYKIRLGAVTDPRDDGIDDITDNTINVRDTDTIDLDYNSTTRTLKADLAATLDLSKKTVILPPVISIPPGAIVPFAGTAAPVGWLLCNGDVVPNGAGEVQGQRYDFSALYRAIGTEYGGQGKLPDLRGYFVRGAGTNSDGTYAGEFGEKQTDTFQGHKHGLFDPTHAHGITDPTHAHGLTQTGHKHEVSKLITGGTYTKSPGLEPFEEEPDRNNRIELTKGNGEYTDEASANITVNVNSTGITVNTNSTGVKVLNPSGDGATDGASESDGPGGPNPRVSHETRPRNIAMHYIIKY